jgi:Xaa-Pro aminopeptidase
LNLKRSQFLEGTNGYQLDMLARSPLWQAGLNYGHGTGHGVGAALCVHEGPFSVSPRKVMAPLTVGNVLSNEPGFYKADSFGMRIENLVTVVEKEVTDSGRFLGFDDLTLCPYDRNLIKVGMLSATERQQVDTYHAWVRKTLSPLLDGKDLAWLEEATKAL